MPQLGLLTKTAIEGNVLEEERTQLDVRLDIVPFCYDESHGKVALLEFRSGIPKFLSGLEQNPSSSSQIEKDDIDISFDVNFHGFTQLYSPSVDTRVTAEYVLTTPPFSYSETVHHVRRM
jgi:hypothetical protein